MSLSLSFLASRAAARACISMLFACAAALHARDAEACSVIGCGVDQLPAGAVVPSNAPALSFERATGRG